MYIKPIIYALALSSISIASHAASITHSLNDPFINTWIHSDGINSYNLNVSTSHAPGHAYSVKFTTPSSSFSSDICDAISNTTIECSPGAYGATLVRDDNLHAITLTSSSGSGIYYDPNYLPKANPIAGVYRGYIKRNTPYQIELIIKIMQTDNKNAFAILTESYQANGGSCGGGLPTTYSVSVNPDNTLLFTYNGTFTHYSFKLDPAKLQITGDPSQRNFDAGLCASLYENNDLVLTKDQPK
jgi:hypothetical protein